MLMYATVHVHLYFLCLYILIQLMLSWIKRFSNSKAQRIMLQVDQMWSGCKNPSLLDRFTLVIPYCLDYIKCECSYVDCVFICVGLLEAWFYWYIFNSTFSTMELGDVIYNAMYPLTAPDIIFGPDEENFQPYYSGDGKPRKNSLADWNCKDPSRLLSLIMELRWSSSSPSDWIVGKR